MCSSLFLRFAPITARASATEVPTAKRAVPVTRVTQAPIAIARLVTRCYNNEQ
jgi:hypothetical protein